METSPIITDTNSFYKAYRKLLCDETVIITNGLRTKFREFIINQFEACKVTNYEIDITVHSTYSKFIIK